MLSSRIAIFIPCYNASSTIRATLMSVQEAIEEAAIDIPVFVYDDCSTDDSIAVAESSWHIPGKFTVIKNQFNLGERKITNLAFNDFNNKFDWVFIIHADDIAKKDWLTSLLALISPGMENYFTIWSSFDSFYRNTGITTPGDNFGKINDDIRTAGEIRDFLTRVYGTWHISGAAIHVKSMLQINGFDEKMAQFGDTDFFVRGLMAGFRDIYLSRTLTVYCTSESSVSSVSLRTNRDIREIFYLIQKFGDILTKQEASSMYRIISTLSARRMIKNLLKGNIATTSLNFKQLLRSLLKQM